MKIAVLGASGVAGQAFLPRAEAAGHSLVTHRADLFDLTALQSLLAGCDVVVNLATSIPKAGGRGDWQTNDRIRREGTANVLTACSLTGVSLLVQQSVAMLHCVADDRPQCEDDPIEGYGVIASALDMEHLIRAASLDWRIVRGGLFYGPGTGRQERWRSEINDPAFRLPGNGSTWVSPIHVNDFAAALLQVIERGHSRATYIACDDLPLRWHELYARVAEKIGAAVPPPGGPPGMRSFRTSNAKLRALGWKPTHLELTAGAIFS
jgi:nucleoside-diphosphate-sugar epimerase